MQRRLATIMVGDFVGSTPAMERDEEAAVARIARGLAIVTEQVKANAGRVFSTAGDAVLAEFASPVSALRAAIGARSALAAAPGLGRADMRFGLHVADVVAVDDDLRGDGVNIAARLQTGAEPGEIEVSGVLYDHVRRVSPCSFIDLGERSLKGVSEPIRVMRVGASMDRHVFQTASTVARPAPERRPNSVAVAPFRTASSTDEDQTFLADGLTDDLILELSRLKPLFVSSRTASQALDVTDPVEIGRALGVRYVLAGSVRKLGPRLRLNITLSETEQGSIVWSDRIQRPFDEVLDVMDEITARVAATVSGRIDHAEISAARRKRPENMTAYEHYLRGNEHHRLACVTEDHAREAVAWFERAQAADPSFARPIAMQVCAWTYLSDFDYAEAERKASRALDLDPADPEVHRIMGVLQIKCRDDYEAARRHHETAIELAPNDAYIIGRCAAFYVFVGEAERALELLERAAELDPFLPVWIVEERIAALYALGRYDEMSAEARRLAFQTRRSRLFRAAARAARGDIERARALVAEALADDPGLTTEYVITQELYQDRARLDELLSRLRAAGLPNPPRSARATVA